MDNIFIFSNESVSKNLKNYNCDNLDIKSISEGLGVNFKVNLIARKSIIERKHSIEKIKIELAENIFSFLKLTFKSLKEKKNSKYFIISITPFTFAACIFLFIFNVRPKVYLRSNGYEEYYSIFGIIGKFVYHLMFEINSKISDLISCRKHILKGKDGNIVSPSHLSEKWFQNLSKPNLENINLLYVGRIRVEKGVFSFFEIFDKLKENIKLSIVCTNIDNKKIKSIKKINLIDTLSENALIDTYDKNNIFVLPSFTEGHPQVLDEALSRLRPVIVFEEISHVTRNRKGIFVCKRNYKDFEDKLNYIINNYTEIQNSMKMNKLPTKKDFLIQLKTFLLK